jgi:hypothetical protein
LSTFTTVDRPATEDGGQPIRTMVDASVKATRTTGCAPAAASPRQDRPRQDHQSPQNVLELLQPGSFVRLRNQPRDLPPFRLLRCRGGRCWVRQQSWGPLVLWEVDHRRLTAHRR